MSTWTLFIPTHRLTVSSSLFFRNVSKVPYSKQKLLAVSSWKYWSCTIPWMVLNGRIVKAVYGHLSRRRSVDFFQWLDVTLVVVDSRGLSQSISFQSHQALSIMFLSVSHMLWSVHYFSVFCILLSWHIIDVSHFPSSAINRPRNSSISLCLRKVSPMEIRPSQFFCVTSHGTQISFFYPAFCFLVYI